MLSYDPVSDLRHWPVSMARFGQTPYGDNRYRIVFAPSRRYLVIGDWEGTGQSYAQWVRKYKALGDIWIMERWRPAEEWATRAEWDLNYASSLGPYPERGEYDFCHGFELSGPSDANLDLLVSMIEYCRTIPLARTRAHIQGEEDALQKAKRNQIDDMIRNRLPAFGCRPVFSRALNRGTEKVHKNVNLRYTAQEVGMPTKPGMRQVLNRA